MENNITPPFSPLIYLSNYEVPEQGEADIQAGMLETLKHISEVTYKDSGHASRSVHAKSHGLLRGEITVLDKLPPTLAQGIFARGGTLPLVIRFSTITGDILDDGVSVPRGMAVKIIGVEGERLNGSAGDVTQDFVLVNGSPSFATSSAKKFLNNLELVAPTTGKAPTLKKALSTVLQATEKMIEAAGGKSPAIIAMGGHPETNLLGETYFSQAPILYGLYMAKIAIVPVSPELVQLTGAPVDLDGKPDGLRAAVVDFFARHTAVWELRVQLCTDIEAMPIEDASVPWPEDRSPYTTVARITAAPQAAWNDALSAAVDDRMSFNPWHGIAAHRPIGSIMRVRKAAYQMSFSFRAERNGVPMREPATLDDFPSVNRQL